MKRHAIFSYVSQMQQGNLLQFFLLHLNSICEHVSTHSDHQDWPAIRIAPVHQKGPIEQFLKIGLLSFEKLNIAQFFKLGI